MVSIGLSYKDGNGVPQDFNKAAEYFRKAIATGKSIAPLAMSALASLYQKGSGVQQDEGKAIQLYTQSAEAGDSTAMNELGWHFREKKEFAKAYQWFKRGTDAGNVESMDGLGYCYLNGEGVKSNAATAVELFKKSASASFPAGLYHLGWCYTKGIGVPADRAKGVSLLQKSADAGFASAQLQLDILSGKVKQPSLQKVFFDTIMSMPTYRDEAEEARQAERNDFDRRMNMMRFDAGLPPIR